MDVFCFGKRKEDHLRLVNNLIVFRIRCETITVEAILILPTLVHSPLLKPLWYKALYIMDYLIPMHPNHPHKRKNTSLLCLPPENTGPKQFPEGLLCKNIHPWNLLDSPDFLNILALKELVRAIFIATLHRTHAPVVSGNFFSGILAP